MEVKDFKKMAKKVESSIKKFESEPRILNLAIVFDNYNKFRSEFDNYVCNDNDYETKTIEEHTEIDKMELNLQKKICIGLKEFCNRDEFGTRMSKAYEMLMYE